jgi:hypothetical protein
MSKGTNDYCTTLSAIIELARRPATEAEFGGGLEFSGCPLESLHLIDGELHAIWGSGGAVIDDWSLLEDLTRGVTSWTRRAAGSGIEGIGSVTNNAGHDAAHSEGLAVIRKLSERHRAGGIPYREAAISWNGAFTERVPEVRVANIHDPDAWPEHLISSGGASWVARREATGEEALRLVLLDFVNLVTLCGLDPLLVAREFIKIDEFRWAMPSELRGDADGSSSFYESLKKDQVGTGHGES